MNPVAPVVELLWPDAPAERVRLHALGKSGGAGEVFGVEGHADLVAKIYHPSIAGPARARYAAKLRWMLRHPPRLPPLAEGSAGIVQAAWPLALVRRDGAFAGFVMKQVDFERTIELDYLLTRRQAAAEGLELDMGKLLTVSFNLAALVDCLHAGRMAVVDLKPINVKVYKRELYVAILDCDGFCVHAEDFVAEAPQVTPDYLAPEFQGRTVDRPQGQDAFALATIIFRLLNFGIHPYAGIAPEHRDVPSELAGRIRLGLYPYARHPGGRVRAVPASVHACFPDELRALFDRAFGAEPAQRPAPHEWAQALHGYAQREAGRMDRCGRGHLRFAGKDCPSCQREGVLSGHAARRRRVLTRLKAAPASAIHFARRSWRGSQPSPFQAALAQHQHAPVQLAPITISLRNQVGIELLWLLGLFITYWWLR